MRFYKYLGIKIAEDGRNIEDIKRRKINVLQYKNTIYLNE